MIISNIRIAIIIIITMIRKMLYEIKDKRKHAKE